MAKNDLCISASIREKSGKGSNKRLRKNGNIPCIVYGHGVEPVSISTPFKEIESAVHHPSIISLSIGGEKNERNVIIKDVQRDYLNTTIIHVDFQQVKMDEKITATIPLECIGEPVGTHHGGQLDQIMHDIEVACLPKDIPDILTYDVSHLNVGDAVTVGDIPLPNGVEGAFSDPNAVAVHLVTSKLAQSEEAEEQEEAAGEPEVIDKAKKDE